MAPPSQDAILRQFREELVSEDMLHDGDSIGTEDHVLLFVAVPTCPELALTIHLDDFFGRGTSTSSKPRSCGRTVTSGARLLKVSVSMNSTEGLTLSMLALARFHQVSTDEPL